MGGLFILIPSYNVASTIAYVISTAAEGLRKYFPEQDAVIFISDGGSSDGTIGVVKSLKISDVDICVERYEGVSGKGSAILYGFRKAVDNGFDAIIMLDSDLRSIEPWWIKLLGRVLDKYDLITPLYTRDKFDGTITKTLAYPVIKSVFKANIRQPIGGDFGISGRLAEVLLERKNMFIPDVYRFGIDFFITSTAVSENMRIAQADLGSKIHAPKDPGKHLRKMFLEVSKTVIRAILNYQHVVKMRKYMYTDVLKWKYSWKCPQHVEVDIKACIDRFLNEYREKASLIKEILGDKIIDMVVEKMGQENAFPDNLWAKLFFKLVSKYRHYGDKVAEVLYVLWLGKVASYLHDVADKDILEAEKMVENIVSAFKEIYNAEYKK